MKKLIVIASLVLAAIMFASGYLVTFLVTAAAMGLDLPGPLAESPMAWVWFATSMLILFGLSIAFCSWFARRIEKKIVTGRTFE